jgi:hypothetical protein
MANPTMKPLNATMIFGVIMARKLSPMNVPIVYATGKSGAADKIRPPAGKNHGL